jgi:hypothetical protein
MGRYDQDHPLKEVPACLPSLFEPKTLTRDPQSIGNRTIQTASRGSRIDLSEPLIIDGFDRLRFMIQRNSVCHKDSRYYVSRFARHF